MIIENLIILFKGYGFLISFLGGLIGGESVMISLSFFWATGYLKLFDILIFALLGAILCDIIIFYIGGTKYISRIIISKKVSFIYIKIDKFIEETIHRNVFLLLLITRFIYLASPVAIAYLGTKKIKFRVFIISDLIVTLIWIVPMMAIGYSLGKGFSFAYSFFQNIYISLSLLIIIIILLTIFRKWITKKLIHALNP